MNSESKSEVISRVEEGQQAIVITLLAKNKSGESVLDSQLELAINMAKNVLQMAGAEVDASGSAIRFDPLDVGKTARLTATLDVIAEATTNNEPTEEPSETEAEE